MVIDLFKAYWEDFRGYLLVDFIIRLVVMMTVFVVGFVIMWIREKRGESHDDLHS